MQTNLFTTGCASSLTMIAAMALLGLFDHYISRIAEYLRIWQLLTVSALFGIPLIGLPSYFGFGRLRSMGV